MRLWKKRNKRANKPIHIWRDKRVDYKDLKVKRDLLLPYLNLEIEGIGIIKKYGDGYLFHKRTPKACLINVIVNKEIILTHLWVEHEDLRFTMKNDLISFTGTVCTYKDKSRVCFGVKEVRDVKRIPNSKEHLSQLQVLI